MTEEIRQSYPESYYSIEKATKAANFSMASDVLTCSLLRTLAGTKPGGKFLELGTGTGLSTAWILDGMDASSALISIDNEQEVLNIAQQHLSEDKRLELICADGNEWIEKNHHQKFDYIFADAWPGKYFLLDETLSMLNKGGMYIIDDMLPQSNWPEGHEAKAGKLIEDLEKRNDITLTKQCWATGMIIATKKV
jgi:predicted O-methyltransferase YrrM